MNLRIKIVLSIIVSLLLLISIAGFSQVVPPPPYKEGITGRVMAPSPEANKDVTGWIPVIDATLTLTDSEGIKHTVTTGEDGYYIFTNVAVDAKCVITATATVNGKTMVFKDIIPQPVAADEFYDAGTIDTESTALALIVEKLIEQGITPEDINLEEIQASDSFTTLVEQVSSVLEEGGDITTDSNVTEAVDNAGDEIINSSLISYKFEATKNDALSLDVTGTINYGNYTISLTVPYGTDVTALIATFVLLTGATAEVGVTPQESGVTSNDFTSGSVVYTVTAEDGTTTQNWTVTVNITSPNNDATLSDLTVDGTTITGFNPATLSYSKELPYRTETVPTVGATPTDPNVTSVVITQAANLTGTEVERTATVIITAEDSSNQLIYSVTFSVAPNDDATLSDLTVDGKTVTDFISSTYTYNVELPYGTTLVPEVEATLNDFNASVTIDQAINLTGSEEQRTATVLVTAEDGTTQKTYTVVFTVGVLDHIVISPDYTTITAGETQTYTAEAFDVNDNTLGDVTAETSFVIQAGAGGSWTDNIYTSETAGISWIVTGTYSEKFDTAALTVTMTKTITNSVTLSYTEGDSISTDCSTTVTY